ncbi:unnamed protein product [Closterium sp. Yama58-4]|nr:unnamed protein product [Closterium sp. Yama58-4]
MALVPFNDRSNASPPESSSITDSRNGGLVVWEASPDDTDDLAFVQALELAEASAKRRRTGESGGHNQWTGRHTAVASAGNTLGGAEDQGGGWSGGGASVAGARDVASANGAVVAPAFSTQPATPDSLSAQPPSPAQPAQPVVMRPADFRNMQSAALDVLEPGDYMVMQGKPYIKKSGWRKIAFFFNLSFEIRDKTIERDERGNVTRSEFLVRASMPSGRFSDAWGSCDRGEKRFSKPNHDIPGTAETRAKSRACQDLLGIGECKQHR